MSMRTMISILLYVLGIGSVFYSFIILGIHSGSKFFLFWDILGLVLVLIGIAVYIDLFSRFPRWLNAVLCILLALGVLLCGILTVRILSMYNKTAPSGLDYIVVLGAQVRADGPSTVLKFRLDAACEYLNANPDTICIVSGAQGYNEPCTEAQGMKDYLVSRGIDESRILLEEQAVNTQGNIRYSSLMIPEGASVGIVTNNFHMFRAMFLCRKLGLANASPIVASSLPLYAPNNVVREICGLMKDFIF